MISLSVSVHVYLHLKRIVRRMAIHIVQQFFSLFSAPVRAAVVWTVGVIANFWDPRGLGQIMKFISLGNTDVETMNWVQAFF